MRACELMAGRTDMESALLARGAVAMTLLSIAIVRVKYTVIKYWFRIEKRGPDL